MSASNRSSIKTRITVFSLALFLFSIWWLAFYVSRMLREDLQQQLGAQQFTTVSMIAGTVNEALLDRMHSLELVAADVSKILPTRPVGAQLILEQRPLLQRLFNGGVLVLNTNGDVIADVPVETGRVGVNLLERDSIAAALKHGKATVGQIVMGKKLGAPIFHISIPIRNPHGDVIGALSGVTNLGLPNFLDKLIVNAYGKTGGYLVAEIANRRLVTATDQRRVMETLPAVGLNPVIDRFMAGYEGHVVFVNPQGVEVLASVKGVPLAGWYLLAALPSAEAFAPIGAMQQRMLWAAVFITLLVGILLWWMLKHQLAPMLAAVNTLSSVSDNQPPLKALPIRVNDEVGDLIGGFNQLLSQLGEREQALHASEFRWKFAIEGSGSGVWDWNIETGAAIYSARWKQLLGFGDDDDSLCWSSKDEWDARIHPDDQVAMAAALDACLTGAKHTCAVEHRLRCRDGGYKWFMARGIVASRDTEQKPLRMIGTITDVTERKATLSALQASESWFSSVFENTNTGIAEVDLNRQIITFNEAFRVMMGFETAELARMNLSDITHPDDLPHEMLLLDEMLSGQRNQYHIVKRYLAAHKKILWVELSVGKICDANGEISSFVGVIKDITEAKLAEAELRIAATAFASSDGMVVTDANSVILRVNRAFLEITGYSEADVIGRTPRMFKSYRHDDLFYADMWSQIQRNGRWQGEIWDRRKNGEEYPKWVTISAVRGDDGIVTHYLGTHSDMTERKLAEQKIEELAYFDLLTHLPNRTLLIDRLKQALATSHRNQTHGAVLFIDLDNFKTLNDTQGHDKGDLLLEQVAQRLTACVREGDTIARLGGDEFVVVLELLSADAHEAATQTELVGEKILGALDQSYVLGTLDHRSTASIGATLFLGQQASLDDLLKQADLAMYKSKEIGRNALSFFDPVMQTNVVERAALEKSMRTALQEQQFVLHYQPQIVDVGRVTGAEVLVRWQHPERGMVPPNAFIPLAEDTGLILPLGKWVLETACATLANWASQPELAHLTLAVNVSAHQFREADFVDQVMTIIRETGTNPSRLKLELTESLLVNNVQQIIEKMHALKGYGVGFSLDDFGTGYSSLSYLKRLPLDQLKIDQSFVLDVLVDSNDAVIAKTIIVLGQSLGLNVIAEGVETESQRDFLAQSGCHAYQGYLYSRPLPVAQFEQFVRQR